MRHVRFVIVALIAAWLPTSLAAPSELRPFDAASAGAIASAHAGRPYVVAFWSIHCAPCLEDMKDWRALAQKFPDVPIILVTTDPPSERAKVRSVLARYQLDQAESWAFADEFVERVRFAVDKGWRGELPRTYYYDARHRVDVRSGRVDHRVVDAWFARQSK